MRPSRGDDITLRNAALAVLKRTCSQQCSFGFEIFTIYPDASRFAVGQEACIGAVTLLYGANCPLLVSLTSARMNEVLHGWQVVFLQKAIKISDHSFSWTAKIRKLGFKLKFLANNTDREA